MAFLVGGANSATGGYEISNSLRFNPGDSAKLNFTQGTPTSRRTWTYSLWVKRGNLGNVQASMLSWGDEDYFDVRFQDGTPDDGIMLYISDGDSKNISTNRLFRDPSAWYHIVINSDTTDGTAGDRTRIYVNGVEETSFANEAQPDQNYDYRGLVSGDPIVVGNRYTGSHYFDGYIAEAHFIDGQQLAPSSFGETDEDSGIWKPKKYTGTYGTNGFFLEFKQTGTDADASGIGADTSGNDNHMTVTNLAATDQTTDTPTNNFCTLNSVDNDGVVLSEGNLTFDSSSGNNEGVRGTMGVQNGKWYYECTITGSAGMAAGNLGYSRPEVPVTSGPASVLGLFANGSSTFGLYNNSSGKTSLDASDGIDQNDVIGVALDLDNDTIAYYRESSIMGSAQSINASILGDFLLPVMLDDGGANDVAGHFNFGNPTVALDSGNADENGYGNFEHAPPSGYYALCTKNLAEYG